MGGAANGALGVAADSGGALGIHLAALSAQTHQMGGGYMRVLNDNGTARPLSPETLRRLAATLSAIRPLVVSDEAAEAVLRSGDFLSFFVWFTDNSLLVVPQEEDELVVASCVELLEAVTTAFEQLVEQDACFISCVLTALSLHPQSARIQGDGLVVLCSLLSPGRTPTAEAQLNRSLLSRSLSCALNALNYHPGNAVVARRALDVLGEALARQSDAERAGKLKEIDELRARVCPDGADESVAVIMIKVIALLPRRVAEWLPEERAIFAGASSILLTLCAPGRWPFFKHAEQIEAARAGATLRRIQACAAAFGIEVPGMEAVATLVQALKRRSRALLAVRVGLCAVGLVAAGSAVVLCHAAAPPTQPTRANLAHGSA